MKTSNFESGLTKNMGNTNNDDIVKALHAGLTVKAICKELGVPQSTVYFVKTTLKDQGNILRKPGSGRPISKTTLTFVADLRARFRRTPNKPFRKMAKDLNVDEKTIRNVAKRYGFKSRAKTRKFLLTARLRASRLEKRKKIIWFLKKKTTSFCSRTRSISPSTKSPTAGKTGSSATRGSTRSLITSKPS